MPGQEENLRFTTELKDLFTETWEKIVGNVEKGTATIKKNIATVESEAGTSVEGLTGKMATLGKGLALVGAGVAIGGIVYEAWNQFKIKIAETTKEAEKLEATLGNILGSRGAAKNVLSELANTDLAKTFNIKDIDEGYMNLANHGLKATLAQMKGIGELGAGTNRNIAETSEAIISATEGRFEQLKRLGIDVTKHKETISHKGAGELVMGMNGMHVAKSGSNKEKIDDLTFTFRGQSTTVKNNAAAIKDYLLQLGMMNSMQGNTARIANTVTGSETALHNEMDKLTQSLAERFRPAVIEHNVWLTKMVATVGKWFEIPIEKKINDEISKIKILQAELTSTNTSEERRLEILNELKDLNPEITNGINAQSIEYGKLADNIDRVVTSLRDKSVAAYTEKKYSGLIQNYNDLEYDKQKLITRVRDKGSDIFPDIMMRSDIGDDDKLMLMKNRLEAKDNAGRARTKELLKKNSFITTSNTLTKDESFLLGNIGAIKTVTDNQLQFKPEYDKAQERIAFLKGKMGLNTIDSIAAKDQSKENNKITSLDKGGIASVSGGGQIKNIVVNIDALVKGGITINTQHFKDSVQKSVDMLKEGFLSIGNDANLIGGN